ncbi:MAG: glutamate formimidoyltransferase [Actinomycetota bacterium]
MPPVPILECVPNLSEGRRPEVIERLANAARLPGVSLLDLHADADHNRCVLTLAGSKAGLIEAVLALAYVAVEGIDLAMHEGVHPRLGALDVVPFVPVAGGPGGGSMSDAAEAAHGCADRIWSELLVPCFFYGGASPSRRTLPEIRRAAFSSLAADLGGPGPHPTAGAVAVGARGPLVAYNVLLATDDLPAALEIARLLRASNRGLPHIRALGFRLPNAGAAQVSLNLVKPETTTMADAWDAIGGAASRLHAEVLGAEVVGLVPAAALGGRRYDELGLATQPKILEEEIRQRFDLTEASDERQA